MLHSRFRRARFAAASLVSSSLAFAAISCLGPGWDPAGDGGARVVIAVAPLELTGVVEACYDLTVTNAPGGGGDTVWSRAGICSTAYGDGAGAISYVGTCDAGAGGANTVALTMTSLEDAGGATAFVNPCPASVPCRIEAACVADADTAVSFELTVMRPARQGFFDVAVELQDLFCSAKVDCVTDTGDGDGPIALLSPVGGGGRAPTAIMALACTGGLASDTHLYLSDVILQCNNVDATLPITGPAGNVYGVGDPPPAPLLQLATYRGHEQLTDGFGVSWGKVYYNVALALDFDALPGACRLIATASASDGAFAAPYQTPNPAAYPLLEIDVELVSSAADEAYTCTRHPIGDASADGVWAAYTPLATPELFAHMAYVSAGTLMVENRVPPPPPVLYVGTAGVNGYWSTDGVAWNLAANPDGANLQGVEYVNGLFVSTGTGGSIATSADGQVWTKVTGPDTSNHHYLVSGGGALLAGGQNTIASIDGTTWSSSHGSGAYPAITGGRYFTSFWKGQCPCFGTVFRSSAPFGTLPGSASWATLVSNTSVPVYGVAADSAGSYYYYATTDGIWRSTVTGSGFAFHAGPAGTSISTLADDGGSPATMVTMTYQGVAWTSVDDGVTWNSYATSGGGGSPRVRWTGTRFLTPSGPALLASPDGVAWSVIGALPSGVGAVAVKE